MPRRAAELLAPPLCTTWPQAQHAELSRQAAELWELRESNAELASQVEQVAMLRSSRTRLQGLCEEVSSRAHMRRGPGARGVHLETCMSWRAGQARTLAHS